MLSLKIRRFIYIAFILLFLITAPLLVLYTAGYRYNIKKGTVQKVGSISVKTQPPNTNIYLDGQLQFGDRADSTLRINNLTPGKYQLTVELDSYHSWGKTLEVFSNINTFANQVLLFKNNTPENIFNEKINDSALSHNKELLAYTTDDSLQIINLNNSQITKINSFNKNQKIISWSRDNNNLLTKNKDSFYIINLDNPNLSIPLTNIITSNFISLKWDNDINYLLYGLDNKHNFYQINTLTKTYRLLYNLASLPNTDYGSDFYYDNNQIYYTASDNNGWFLKKANLDNNEIEIENKLIKIPSGGDLSFLPYDNYVVLLDQTKQKMYLVDNNFSEIILETDAKDFHFLEASNQLLYYNDFEIWLYNIEDKENQLITRYGQLVQSAQIIPKTNYLIILAGDKLEVVEIDSRDKRNVVELIQTNHLNKFYIHNKGENIFFIAEIGSQSGLFKINIR